MKNKIKITVTEKNLDDAIKCINKESWCINRCVMAKAVREQWRPDALFGSRISFVGWEPGRPEMKIEETQAGVLDNIIDLFDNEQFDSLRACLPVTLEFVEA